MPIVELEKGVWLAAWQGDPGRTLDIRSAKHFKTYKAAEFALMGARNYRPFANAVIRPTPRALDRGKASVNAALYTLEDLTGKSTGTTLAPGK